MLSKPPRGGRHHLKKPPEKAAVIVVLKRVAKSEGGRGLIALLIELYLSDIRTHYPKEA